MMQPVEPNIGSVEVGSVYSMACSDKSRHARAYGTFYDKLCKVILTRDKHLCQACKRTGRVKVGTYVDQALLRKSAFWGFIGGNRDDS